MKNVLLSIIAIISISSCAPLTKSQIKMSHNYFEAITNYPRNYKQLNVRVADLGLEAKNLESSLHTSDSLRITTIVNSILAYESAMTLPKDVLVHVNFIDHYIHEYYVLLPNGFNMYRALKGTTETIGGIFGLGGIVSGILPSNVGGLTPTKKRKIRALIMSSEAELIESLNALKKYINTSYLPRLELINETSIVHFESLLASINSKAPPLDYYTQHNRMLTEFYQRFYHTKNLVYQLSKSIDTFILAEKEISNSFKEKDKVNLEDTHLDDLVSDMQRISSLVQELNSRKNEK